MLNVSFAAQRVLGECFGKALDLAGSLLLNLQEGMELLTRDHVHKRDRYVAAVVLLKGSPKNPVNFWTLSQSTLIYANNKEIINFHLEF